MKLLIATDFSPELCLAEAVNARPWPADTEVRILYVVDAGLFAFGGEAVEAAKEAARAPLEAVARKLDVSRFKTSTEVVAAYPRTEIVNYAKEWGADFVFIGAHRRAAAAQFLLGSVARTVVRNAPCSVEIVRPSKGAVAKELKVLVATDGSECAKAAVQSVARRPWTPGTIFKVTSVVPVFMPITDAGATYFYSNQTAEAIEAMEREALAAATQAQDAARRILKAAGLKVANDEALPEGDPKSVILDEAKQWGADLIIVGSHGRHGMERLMMGSVSEAIAVHAPCSVEVLRSSLAAMTTDSLSVAAN